jgi:hypothetical protein
VSGEAVGELVSWGCVAVIIGFSWSVPAMRHLRRMGRRPSPVLRWTFRGLRALAWPSYVFLGLEELGDVDSIGDGATLSVFMCIIGYGLWRDWQNSKGLDDDDDWMKKLIEKGQGAVERVGNRLRVVVPAPAGA